MSRLHRRPLPSSLLPLLLLAACNRNFTALPQATAAAPHFEFSTLVLAPEERGTVRLLGGTAPWSLRTPGANGCGATLNGDVLTWEACDRPFFSEQVAVADRTGQVATLAVTVGAGFGAQVADPLGVAGCSVRELRVSGGRPPYRVGRMEAEGSAPLAPCPEGPALEALPDSPSGTLRFRAPAFALTGGNRHHVVLRDSATDRPEAANRVEFTLEVQAPLSLPTTLAVAPGSTVALPIDSPRPFRVRFAADGNSSGALLDPPEADYRSDVRSFRAGTNANTVDVLEVDDGTGPVRRLSVLVTSPHVSLPFTSPALLRAADLDGDGLDELLATAPVGDSLRDRLVVVPGGPRGPGTVHSLVVPRARLMSIADVDADGRADVLLLPEETAHGPEQADFGPECSSAPTVDAGPLCTGPLDGGAWLVYRGLPSGDLLELGPLPGSSITHVPASRIARNDTGAGRPPTGTWVPRGHIVVGTTAQGVTRFTTGVERWLPSVTTTYATAPLLGGQSRTIRDVAIGRLGLPNGAAQLVWLAREFTGATTTTPVIEGGGSLLSSALLTTGHFSAVKPEQELALGTWLAETDGGVVLRAEAYGAGGVCAPTVSLAIRSPDRARRIFEVNQRSRVVLGRVNGLSDGLGLAIDRDNYGTARFGLLLDQPVGGRCGLSTTPWPRGLPADGELRTTLSASAMTSGDFDGDGVTDVAVARDDGLDLYLGHPDQAFALGQRYALDGPVGRISADSTFGGPGGQLLAYQPISARYVAMATTDHRASLGAVTQRSTLAYAAPKGAAAPEGEVLGAITRQGRVWRAELAEAGRLSFVVLDADGGVFARRDAGLGAHSELIGGPLFDDLFDPNSAWAFIRRVGSSALEVNRLTLLPDAGFATTRVDLRGDAGIRGIQPAAPTTGPRGGARAYVLLDDGDGVRVLLLSEDAVEGELALPPSGSGFRPLCDHSSPDDGEQATATIAVGLEGRPVVAMLGVEGSGPCFERTAPDADLSLLKLAMFEIPPFNVPGSTPPQPMVVKGLDGDQLSQMVLARGVITDTGDGPRRPRKVVLAGLGKPGLMGLSDDNGQWSVERVMSDRPVIDLRPLFLTGPVDGGLGEPGLVFSTLDPPNLVVLSRVGAR